MSMGLGEHYLVELIDFETGNLEKCLNFIKTHPTKNKHQWYELKPIPDVETGTLEHYEVMLVEFQKKGKK